MANLIDKTYFKGIISLPNLSESSGNAETHLNNLITHYEEKILVDLLGRPLYKEFKTAIDSVSPDQKWLDLRDGKDYQVEYNGSNVDVHWNGLINSEKESFLAYFIYFHVLKDKQWDVVDIGTVSPNSENSAQSSPRFKMVTAYNEGIKLYGSPLYYTNDNPTIRNRPSRLKYKHQLTGSEFDIYNERDFEQTDTTAYNFMKQMNVDNGTDYYNNWIFTYKSKLNTIIT